MAHAASISLMSNGLMDGMISTVYRRIRTGIVLTHGSGFSFAGLLCFARLF